jgi:putative intracellular protease/amidase
LYYNLVLEQQKNMSNRNGVLIILSGSDHLTLKSGKKVETGFFLKELAQPLQQIVDAGYEVVFANSNGTEPHMDPISNKYVWYLGNIAEYNLNIDLIDRMKRETNFKSPMTFASISNENLQRFSGVFIPGGHAPMEDLGADRELGRILKFFHDNSRPIASICHGPIALLSTKAYDNNFLFRDYHITCYSDAEEKTNEFMWWDTVDPKLESSLRENGAVINNTWPMLSKVTTDRELITGQNPSSAYPLGTAFVSALRDVSSA